MASLPLRDRGSNAWTKLAIRVASAGLGAAVAGPLGGAIGEWLGGALGGSATTLIGEYAKEFGDKAGEKLLETATDSLTDRIGKVPRPLEAVYREALRLSLQTIRTRVQLDGFDDWFDNWDRCLGSSAALNHPNVALVLAGSRTNSLILY